MLLPSPEEHVPDKPSVSPAQFQAVSVLSDTVQPAVAETSPERSGVAKN